METIIINDSFIIIYLLKQIRLFDFKLTHETLFVLIEILSYSTPDIIKIFFDNEFIDIIISSYQSFSQELLEDIFLCLSKVLDTLEKTGNYELLFENYLNQSFVEFIDTLPDTCSSHYKYFRMKINELCLNKK